eukprot:3821932-Prymnesium_polylepis.1
MGRGCARLAGKNETPCDSDGIGGDVASRARSPTYARDAQWPKQTAAALSDVMRWRRSRRAVGGTDVEYSFSFTTSGQLNISTLPSGGRMHAKTAN